MSETGFPQILIVDDHELIRTGLRNFLQAETDWQASELAADEQEALQKFHSHPPDLMIVDLGLKNSNGVDLIKRLIQKKPNLLVLVLSMHDEKEYAERALRAGAKGFISKQESSKEILKALQTILSGEIYLSETMSARMLQRLVAGKASPEDSPTECLSDREFEVFQLIGQGLTTEQIAHRLHLSPHTIGTYRERLKTKLNLANSTELTRTATLWVSEQGP